LPGQEPVDATIPSLIAKVDTTSNNTMESSEKDHDQHLDHQTEFCETEAHQTAALTTEAHTTEAPMTEAPMAETPMAKAPKTAHKDSPFVFPSGIPGMGNCILGPRMPGRSTTASLRTVKSTSLNSMELVNSNKSSTAISSASELFNSTAAEHKVPYSAVKSGIKRKADDLESEDIDTANNTSPNLSPSKQRSTSNDAEEYQQLSSLSDLVQEVRDSLSPYTDFHPSCDATEPIKKIHASLSSSTLTPIAVSRLLFDAYTILKALHECQAGTYFKLEPLRGVLQKSDMHSLLEDAYEKVRQTEEDIEQFEKWMEECDAMVTWRAL
jgi:hypothetical protein